MSAKACQSATPASLAEAPAGPFWVFAYGSLMWRPAFTFAESREALVEGYHRRLCIYSTIHRGTPERPGLVLGLDEGGRCRGRAYRVAAGGACSVFAYLYEREMPNQAYVPSWIEATLLPDGERVAAYAFVARRDHWQYCPELGVERMAELIADGEGKGGTGIEYLANTLAHLEGLGIDEPELRAVLDRARALLGATGRE